MVFLEHTLQTTRAYVNSRPKSERKAYGQFFTMGTGAMFMSKLFNVNLEKECLNILDAGAGTGILTSAMVDQLLALGFKGKICVTCYENDSNVLPVLYGNLEEIANNVKQFEYRVIAENFLTFQPFGGFFQEEAKYDLVIGNPPYKKIPIEASEAQHMKEVCHGAPNLYFLFMAMSIQQLKEEGQLVYIIPRSWTSGAYFERFRKWLFARTVIEHIHLFGSRDKVFNGESVLQETMIIKIRKTKQRPRSIKMTFSETSDFNNISSISVPYDTIVSNNNYVYLVTNKKEIRCLDSLKTLDHTLVADGLRMKTGLVVDFRTREVLRNEPDSPNTYPLLYSQHIKNGKIIWPVGKENEYICTENKALLQENANYVFVKRLTAKEERRRLQCGIYLKREYPNYKYISTQNKINYILCQEEEEALGVYCLLNSSIYDLYYRILNGSTQVNSTEINMMPVPDKHTIAEMGKMLKGKELSTEMCDKILSAWIK